MDRDVAATIVHEEARTKTGTEAMQGDPQPSLTALATLVLDLQRRVTALEQIAVTTNECIQELRYGGDLK